jgi:hypothetical protein
MPNRSSRLRTNAAAARCFKLGNIIFHRLSS